MSSFPCCDEAQDPACSIDRCLAVLSDRWSFLIIRDALLGGVERFADFQRNLGIAPNVLADRLEHLVGAGVLARRTYQEPGSRTRRSYHPTPAGRDLLIPLAALQQWGDKHNPPAGGPAVLRRSPSGSPVSVAFIDDAGEPVALGDVAWVESGTSADEKGPGPAREAGPALTAADSPRRPGPPGRARIHQSSDSKGREDAF